MINIKGTRRCYDTKIDSNTVYGSQSIQVNKRFITTNIVNNDPQIVTQTATKKKNKTTKVVTVT